MMTIGQLSKKTGMTIRTIRYYEEKGIIIPDSYNQRGDRLFKEEHLNGILFIKYLRSAGLSIKEVQNYVDLLQKGNRTRLQRQELLSEVEQKILHDISEKQKQLEHVRWKLERYNKGFDC
ncbi:MerR family transcriptional regulator [Lactococcus garvieae]|uniref:MerR family transcriptional regulator n=1 Tax=Lactococcus garvieae TaxID=1363 RepID=UPI00398E5A17